MAKWTNRFEGYASFIWHAQMGKVWVNLRKCKGTKRFSIETNLGYRPLKSLAVGAAKREALAKVKRWVKEAASAVGDA